MEKQICRRVVNDDEIVVIENANELTFKIYTGDSKCIVKITHIGEKLFDVEINGVSGETMKGIQIERLLCETLGYEFEKEIVSRKLTVDEHGKNVVDENGNSLYDEVYQSPINFVYALIQSNGISDKNIENFYELLNLYLRQSPCPFNDVVCKIENRPSSGKYGGRRMRKNSPFVF